MLHGMMYSLDRKHFSLLEYWPSMCIFLVLWIKFSIYDLFSDFQGTHPFLLTLGIVTEKSTLAMLLLKRGIIEGNRKFRIHSSAL